MIRDEFITSSPVTTVSSHLDTVDLPIHSSSATVVEALAQEEAEIKAEQSTEETTTTLSELLTEVCKVKNPKPGTK